MARRRQRVQPSTVPARTTWMGVVARPSRSHHPKFRPTTQFETYSGNSGRLNKDGPAASKGRAVKGNGDDELVFPFTVWVSVPAAASTRNSGPPPNLKPAQSSLSDLPLKSYYRYVIPSMADFSNIDSTVNGPKAFFANMPLTKTLTMNLDVPKPWLVEPVVAVQDLDNILLKNLGETTTFEAVFELEALLLTGHCFEKNHEHPRGLQMILGTRSTPHLVDTLVMSNLGYWQLKASLGMWYLQLALGRSSELYVLKENDGTAGTALAKPIIISALRGKVVHLEVMRKKNKQHEKFLITRDDDSHSETEQVMRGKANTYIVLEYVSGGTTWVTERR